MFYLLKPGRLHFLALLFVAFFEGVAVATPPAGTTSLMSESKRVRMDQMSSPSGESLMKK
jgi:hypothetical protein